MRPQTLTYRLLWLAYQPAERQISTRIINTSIRFDGSPVRNPLWSVSNLGQRSLSLGQRVPNSRHTFFGLRGLPLK